MKITQNRTKAKKIGLIVYALVLHVAIIALVFALLNTKGVVTRQQVKDLALGYALKECLAKQEANIDCASIEIDEPQGSCFQWYCNDPPLWSIGYRTTRGEELRGSFYIDMHGKYVSNEEMARSYT